MPLALLLIIATSISPPANAQNISSSISLVSDYRNRGQTQTHNRPTLQGGINAAHNGWETGLWGSGMDLGEQDTHTSFQLDLYSTYTHKIKALSLSTGITGSLYFGKMQNASFHEHSLFELTAQADLYPVTLSLAYDPVNTTLYINASLEYNILHNLNIHTHIGSSFSANNTLLDYGAYLVYSLSRFDLGAGWAGTFSNTGNIVLSISCSL